MYKYQNPILIHVKSKIIVLGTMSSYSSVNARLYMNWVFWFPNTRCEVYNVSGHRKVLLVFMMKVILR